MQSFLAGLKTARWDTIFHTFGNSHHTLIGLLVDWWIKGGPTDARWALEAPPAFGEGGLCDAVLCEGETPRGVVEVEGTRHAYTIDKIERLFASDLEYLNSLEFGVFLAYAYEPKGWGERRAFPPPPFDDFVEHGKQITVKHPAKQLAILTLEKAFERRLVVPGAKSEYCKGRPVLIRGALLQNGQIIDGDFLVSSK